MSAIALAMALVLSFANGANDVSKGIATLVGSGISDYRRAIWWGTAWTAAGALAGAALGGAMMQTFGKGLLANGVAFGFAPALAVLLGASAWVLIANRTGLPVSTTHAIVGALAGVATLRLGLAGVKWSVLAAKVLAPLLLSPLAAVALAFAIGRLARSRRDARAADCLCIEAAAPVIATSDLTLARAAAITVEITTGASAACRAERPRALRLEVDRLHWLTSGATSLARGLNDAPKIAALVLSASALAASTALSPLMVFATVALGMALGSMVAGRRVTRTLAERITKVDHREGFVANAVTASLVVAGATLGLPMSTTHVSAGAIIGGATAPLDRRVVRDIALAWIVTLPAAAALAMIAALLLRALPW